MSAWHLLLVLVDQTLCCHPCKDQITIILHDQCCCIFPYSSSPHHRLSISKSTKLPFGSKYKKSTLSLTVFVSHVDTFWQKISKFPFTCSLSLYLPVVDSKYFPFCKNSVSRTIISNAVFLKANPFLELI